MKLLRRPILALAGSTRFWEVKWHTSHWNPPVVKVITSYKDTLIDKMYIDPLRQLIVRERKHTVQVVVDSLRSQETAVVRLRYGMDDRVVNIPMLKLAGN